MADELQSNILPGFKSSGLKRIRLSHDSNQKDGNLNSSGQSSPLGLRLSKTPSFVNLVELKLTQARTSPDQTHNAASACNTSRAKKDDFGTEKLKASNFSALQLKIGSWERISRNEGDLMAKCYYAKKKIVWEVLDGDLKSKIKSKIEVQWADIEAIRATIVHDQPGILEIELNQPPQFFRETNPQPRKHTIWHPATDFTRGQAPTFRRHYVRFPPGILDKHYEKLLQCDHRLLELSRKPFPRLQSPYFYSNRFSGTNISFDFRAPQSQVPVHGMQYSLPHMSSSSTLIPQRIQSQGQAIGIADSFSPMSVMDFPRSSDNVNSYIFENPTAAHWRSEGNNGENLLAGIDYIQERQPYIHLAAHHDGASSCHVPTDWGGEVIGRPGSSNLILSDIENHLLGDSLDSCSDERRHISGFRPMCSLLEPSVTSNFSQNIGSNHVMHGQATYDHARGINERLDMETAIPYMQPIHCLPPQVFGGTSTTGNLPTENNCLLPQVFGGTSTTGNLPTENNCLLPQVFGGTSTTGNLPTENNCLPPQVFGGTSMTGNLPTENNCLPPQVFGGTSTTGNLPTENNCLPPQVFGGTSTTGNLPTEHNCLPPQVFGGTSMTGNLPIENNSYGFSNLAAEDYEFVDASHEVWQ